MTRRRKLIMAATALVLVIAAGTVALLLSRSGISGGSDSSECEFVDTEALPQDLYIYDVLSYGGETYTFCSESFYWHIGPRYILQEGSSQAMVYPFSEMAWWENGERLIYTSGFSLYSCTADGQGSRLIHTFGNWFYPSIDGVFGDYAILTSESDVAMVDLNTGETNMVIIPSGFYDNYLAWDGEWIYFSYAKRIPTQDSGNPIEYTQIGRFSTVTGEDYIITVQDIEEKTIYEPGAAAHGYLYFQYDKRERTVARIPLEGGIAESLDIPFSDYGIRGSVDIFGYQGRVYISAMHRNEAESESVKVYLLDGGSGQLEEALSLPVEGQNNYYAAASISSGVFAAVFDDGRTVSGSIA